MSIAPKTIAVTVSGLVVVVGAFIAAPALGDMLAPSLAGNERVILGDAVEYGVNAAGETFGSPVEGTVPKLIPAMADEGIIGYVRVSELDHQRNLAKSSTNAEASFQVKVYESDGTNVIGSLAVDKDTPGPRDGFNK
jgi:hypothetical protein